MSSLVADYGNSSDSNSSIESNELQDKERYLCSRHNHVHIGLVEKI